MNDYFDVIDDTPIAEPRNARGRLEGDENATVTFYKKAVRNATRSAAEGRPIFDEEYFVSIVNPSDPFNKPFFVCKQAHKDRFPIDWQNFLNSETSSLEGTPLEHYKGVTKARAAEMRAQGIYTVESLADLSDVTARQFGWQAAKEKAVQWIANTKEEAIAQKSAETAKAMEEMQRRNDEMAAMMAIMKTQLDGMSSKKKVKAEAEEDDAE